ncbi:hypothetical protein H4O09_11760 [Stenotrophomonas sp. W1S232]|uniref:Uncharacterized protein n=1 Tax=Stenotrophomonas koreensis TaxID=266128 RepID=A0A7W3V1I9_9GAMM|nr:hypothetical protein [Stenotrophomonas koreensis]MBB1117726.1 hypothetical protein [Stenotrophomonas koreensis]
MPKPTRLLPCLAVILLLSLTGCRHGASQANTPAPASTSTATAKEGLARLTPQQQHDEEVKRWDAWPIREGHSPERAWQGVLHILRTVPRFADITPEIAGPALGMPGQSLPPPLRGYSARIHPDWALGWVLDERTVVPMLEVSVGHRPVPGSTYMDPAPVCDGPTDWAVLRPELEAMGFTLWAQWGALDYSSANDHYALSIDLLPSTQLNGRLCIKGITLRPMPQQVRP